MKYYIVGFSEDRHKEFEVKEVSIKDGTIIFFDDEERTAIKAIIPAGKWSYLQAQNRNSTIQLAKAPVIELVDDHSQSQVD